MIVSAASRIVERDLVRRLLALRALDEGDHPVEERLAGVGRDLDDDPVGEDPGAARDGAPVAAGLADDRSGLAGDGGLVDRGDALDDLAVGGDDVAASHDDAVALAEFGGGDTLFGPVGATSRRASVSERILRSVSACALPRPSAMASAKFAKRTVKHSQIVMRPVERSPGCGDRLDEASRACRRGRRT